MTDLFCEIVNGLRNLFYDCQLLIIFAKNFILYVWQGSNYASVVIYLQIYTN